MLHKNIIFIGAVIILLNQLYLITLNEIVKSATVCRLTRTTNAQHEVECKRDQTINVITAFSTFYSSCETLLALLSLIERCRISKKHIFITVDNDTQRLGPWVHRQFHRALEKVCITLLSLEKSGCL